MTISKISIYLKNILLCFFLTFCLPYANAQEQLIKQLDELLGNEDFNNWDSAFVALNNIKPQCEQSTSKELKCKFAYAYGATLYNINRYEECIKYINDFLRYTNEDSGFGISSCEILGAYQSLGKCYIKLNKYDEAEAITRKGIIRYNTILTECYDGHLMYENLLEIMKEKQDTVLLPQVHHDIQKCKIYFYASEAKNESWDKIKQQFDQYSDTINLSLQLSDLKTALEYRDKRSFLLQGIAFDDEAEYEYLSLIQDIHQKAPDEKEILMDSYLGLVKLYNQSNNIAGIRKILPEINTYLSNNKTTNDNIPFLIYNTVGLALDKADCFSEARDYFHKSISLCKNDSLLNIMKGIMKDNIAISLNLEAVSYIKNNTNLSKAKSNLQKAEELTSDPQLKATILHNIGKLEMMKGNYSEALKILKESAQIQKDTNGSISDKTTSYINECIKHL